MLVFKNEYRFDLKRFKSVLIPYVFNHSSLIINLKANPSKRYRSSGRLDQMLIDYPNKLIASSQILRFNNQLLDFPQEGRYQLLFYPNYYLGKFQISIKVNASENENSNIIPQLNRIEQKIDDISAYNGQ